MALSDSCAWHFPATATWFAKPMFHRPLVARLFTLTLTAPTCNVIPCLDILNNGKKLSAQAVRPLSFAKLKLMNVPFSSVNDPKTTGRRVSRHTGTQERGEGSESHAPAQS